MADKKLYPALPNDQQSLFDSLDIGHAFRHFPVDDTCVQMSKNNTEQDYISDDTSSSGNDYDPSLRTTEEERDWGTIPASDIATAMALAHRTAQVNPTVPRGNPKGKLYLKRRTKSKETSPQTAKRPKNTATSKVCNIL